MKAYPLFLSMFYESFSEDESGECQFFDRSVGTFFEYVPDDGVVIFDDFSSIRKEEERVENELDRFFMKASHEEKFHLEKSGPLGLKLLSNFLAWDGRPGGADAVHAHA